MPKRDASDATEFSNDEIISIVNEIHNSPLNPKERARMYRRKYPEFAERFTSLFEMVCAPSFDVSCLISMLRLRERIHSSKMDVDSASRIIGQQLYDKYVADKVDDSAPPAAPSQ